MQKIFLILVGIFACISETSADGWLTKTALPTGRASLAIGVINNKIYAIGGSTFEPVSTNEEYDPVTNTWATKASMPTARWGPAIGAVNNKLYVIGGAGGQNTNEEYDPATNTWTTRTGMPTGRYCLAIGVVNNKIYAIGGMSALWMATNEEYDPAADSWTSRTAMPTLRYRHAIGVVNNQIYVMGGYNGSSGGVLTTNEMYDPATNTWTAKAGMPTARDGLAIGVINKKIYAIGGEDNSGNSYSKNEMHDPVTNTWATKTSMPTARYFLAIGVVNNRIYAIGGGGGTGAENEMFACFTPEVVSPNGGETWPVGALRTVSVCGADSNDYYLSLDGGYSYQLAAKNAGDVYTLRIPHTPTHFALIKAVAQGQDPDDPANYDVSDSLFMIQSTIVLLAFTAGSDSDGGVQLSWQTDPCVPDINGYNLYRSIGQERFEKINNGLIADDHYNDIETNGGIVIYRLGAVNGWNHEYIVGEVTFTKLDKPLILSPTIIKNSGKLFFDVPQLSSTEDETEIEVAVYDILGKKLITLCKDRLVPGYHSLQFDGLDEEGSALPPGTYFIIMNTPKYIEHTKFIKF